VEFGMKVQISLDDELMVRIDNNADNNYMSRSGLISLACTQFLNTAELTFAIKDMALAMRMIADKGEIDEEALVQLQDFERIIKVLSSGSK
jgi:metal-responsive CopG/Arc/MetJ family transcriptional regulator